MANIFAEMLGGIVSPIAGFFNERQKIKAAERERKDKLKQTQSDAKLERARNGNNSDIEMDNRARQLSGWMDDFSFAVFIAPAILAFVPPAVPHVTAGFEALESMPQWYQYTLALMLAAVWGYRRLVTPLFEILVKHYSKKIGV